MSDSYGKKSCPNPIYFDNNSTTIICQKAKDVFKSWLECYNASSDSKFAKPAKKILEKANDDLLSHCNVSSATHSAIFTSCGSESNCFIIKACVKAYKRKLDEKSSILKPHIIVSAMEHHSILECCKDLEETGQVDVSYISPTIYGNIIAADVEKEIKPSTCLISIMFANNEVPVINNIAEIGAVAHRRNIPMHSDCVQIFGKYPIDLKKHNLDAISASAHKFYGPKGCGILIINNELIEGYGLTAEIAGSQQHHLRGGTENIACIASTMVALHAAFIKRKEKNMKLLKLRDHLLDKLEKLFCFAHYEDYINEVEHKDLELISLGPPREEKGFTLPNTVLLAVAKNKGKPFCNVKFKKDLDDRGCVVSIGSACLTSDTKASHVLTAIGAPPVIKRGVIRISFGDSNTIDEVNKFIRVLVECITKQCSDIDIDTPDKKDKKEDSKEIKEVKEPQETKPIKPRSRSRSRSKSRSKGSKK